MRRRSQSPFAEAAPLALYKEPDGRLAATRLARPGKLAQVGFVWPKGLLNPGGPHRRLRGHHYPISIGEDECLVFGKLIAGLRPQHCYIIGNAFGFGSAYIADAMKHNGGKSVITLDNQSEGAGAQPPRSRSRCRKRSAPPTS